MSTEPRPAYGNAEPVPGPRCPNCLEPDWIEGVEEPRPHMRHWWSEQVEPVDCSGDWTCTATVNLNGFPRRPGETNDAPRLRRAMDALKARGGGVLWIHGVFDLREPEHRYSR